MLRPAMRPPLRPIMHSPLQARRGCGSAPAFAFTDLFAAGEGGIIFDIHPSRLWQDSARTVPVTADGQPVGCIDDESGNANHALQVTSGQRPLYKTDGSLRWLEGDGVDDDLIVTLPASMVGLTITAGIAATGLGAFVSQTTIIDPVTHLEVWLNSGFGLAAMFIVDRALTESETTAATALLNQRAGV